MNNLLPNTIFGIVGAVAVIALVGRTGAPSLEVKRWGAITADDGFAFDVTNVDYRTVTLAATKINNRSDCKATPISLAGEAKLPIQLKVGDKTTFLSSCRVIRVEIETDHGSAEYSF